MGCLAVGIVNQLSAQKSISPTGVNTINTFVNRPVVRALVEWLRQTTHEREVPGFDSRDSRDTFSVLLIDVGLKSRWLLLCHVYCTHDMSDLK